jgi:hypothetical protein
VLAKIHLLAARDPGLNNLPADHVRLCTHWAHLAEHGQPYLFGRHIELFYGAGQFLLTYFRRSSAQPAAWDSSASPHGRLGGACAG